MLERKNFMNIQLFGEEEENVNIDDIDIAEQASKIISEKDKKINSLMKQVAQMKLLQEAPVEDNVVEERTAEEAMKDFYKPSASNYDVMKAFYDTIKANEREGISNDNIGSPEEISKVIFFLDEVFEACGDDKNSFNAYYQAMLSEDEPSDRQAYLKATKKH